MRKLIFPVIFTSIATFVSAQPKRDTANVIRTATQLASGNYKDVLTSFFQLAYQDLTDHKEFNFSSNIFAIKLKTDPTLNISKNFLKQTFARNSNIKFSLQLDSNFHFGGVKGGYKYALVNRRDYAISRAFNYMVLQATHNYAAAFNAAVAEISRRYPEDEGGRATALVNEMNHFFNDTTNRIQFSQLSKEAKELIETFFIGNEFHISDSWDPRRDLNSIYQNLISDFQKKLLWTVESNFATYPDGKLFSNIELISEAAAGVIPINHRNNIEFSAKVNYSFRDDSLSFGRDLNRQLLLCDFGFNWVCRNARSKPALELKAAGSLQQIPMGIYKDERRSEFLFAGTLRIHITDNISVPIEIHYDPKSGNVFGFLNVRSNFDWLNGVFGALN